MYKPDKKTQKLKDLIDDEFRVKGYIRWPFVEAYLNELEEKAIARGHSIHNKRIQDKLIAKGLCRACGKKRNRSVIFCDKHLEMDNERRKLAARRERRNAHYA